jgi:hypothetical protein
LDKIKSSSRKHPKPTPQRHGKQHRQNTRAVLLCAVALHFFVMVFVANAHAAAAHPRTCGVQPLQPSAQTKTNAKKDGGKLNNIMNLIRFF